MLKKLKRYLKRTSKSKKGMSLVEIIVALMIVSIVIAGVTSGLSFSYNTVLKDGMVDEASSTAQDMMDILTHTLKSNNRTILKNNNYMNVTIISELSMSSIGDSPNYDDDAVYVTANQAAISGFPQAYNGSNSRQFTIKPSTCTIGSATVNGFEVKVAVYYTTNGSSSFVIMENFIASIDN